MAIYLFRLSPFSAPFLFSFSVSSAVRLLSFPHFGKGGLGGIYPVRSERSGDPDAFYRDRSETSDLSYRSDFFRSFPNFLTSQPPKFAISLSFPSAPLPLFRLFLPISLSAVWGGGRCSAAILAAVTRASCPRRYWVGGISGSRHLLDSSWSLSRTRFGRLDPESSVFSPFGKRETKGDLILGRHSCLPRFLGAPCLFPRSWVALAWLEVFHQTMSF